jgi:hypothetical protein
LVSLIRRHCPVHQPTPGKAISSWKNLPGRRRNEIPDFRSVGLDHGPEWYHAKITGISTQFIKPPSGKHVYMTTSVPTTETDAIMTNVTLEQNFCRYQRNRDGDAGPEHRPGNGGHLRL